MRKSLTIGYDKSRDGIILATSKRGEIFMQTVPVRSAAIRMAILLISVCALAVAAVFLAPNPRLWCAIIPALIPLLTPVVLLPLLAKSRK
jgi:hypothetical protein